MKIISLRSKEKLHIVSSVSYLFISGLCIHCLAFFCFALHFDKICVHTSTGRFVLPGDYTGTKSTLIGNGRDLAFSCSLVIALKILIHW